MKSRSATTRTVSSGLWVGLCVSALWGLLIWAGCENSPLDFGQEPAPRPDYSGPMPRWISWSPQGDKIVYEQGGTLFVAPASDLNDARILTGQGRYRHPFWSPDGQFLAHDYATDDYHQANLWVRSVSGKVVPRRLTDTRALDQMPVWSPDGRWIAFHSRRSPGNHVWVVESSSGTPRALGPALANERSLAWSPEGAQLAYEAPDNGASDIWLADPNTGETRRLAGTDATDVHPTWRPDGHAVAFLSLAKQGWNVWVQEVNPDGEARQITTKGSVIHFSWIADGRALLFQTADGLLYAQGVVEGAAVYIREARDFAVSPDAARYIYVEYLHPSYKLRMATAPDTFLAP